MLMIFIKQRADIVLEMDLISKAVIALLAGILPNVPGFLTTTKIISCRKFWPWLSEIYHYAWFVGFFVSVLSMRYLCEMK